MSEENFNLSIILDTNEAQNQLKDIEQKTKNADVALEEVKKKSRETTIAVISIIRVSYGILRGVLRASGITIDAVTNAVIQSALMMGQQMYTIATAQAVTPGMAAAAIITGIQAGVVMGTAFAAQGKAADITRDIETANMIIGNVNAMVGLMHF